MGHYKREKLRALHRALWSWMMKHPGAEKEQWPGWKAYERCVAIRDAFWHSSCFACLACNEDCGYCPIVDRVGNCYQKKSTFAELTEYMGKPVNPVEYPHWRKLCRTMRSAWH